MSEAQDFEVTLPGGLARFGGTTKARIVGAAGAPVLVALGGISANRFVADDSAGGPGWWSGLIGPGRAIDPARWRVLGLDFAADDEGRAAPSTADQAEVLEAALDTAAINKVHAILGASYGGMIALAFAALHPERVAKLVVLSAATAPHSFSTAQRELQRRVVALGLEAGRGEEGLAIARGMAMLTYRTAAEFGARFAGGIEAESPLAPSAPGAYLRARGATYPAVMSPGRFLSLSASIDRHKVDPAAVRCPVLAIGATSDNNVPSTQMEALAAALPNARLQLRDCLQGHDMFLVEAEALGATIGPFLEEA